VERLRELLNLIGGFRGFREVARETGYFWSAPVAFRGLCALWLRRCTLAVAIRLTRCVLPRVGLPLRWSGVFVVGSALATVGFQLLLALHAFNLPCARSLSTATSRISVRTATSLGAPTVHAG
jgi:hypothetical protein